MNGVLVVDKPCGPTSHDVVARARRALGLIRIGHTGTLDPLATGVLPLVLGRATRLARFIASGDKVYEAAIRLGAATDTYDATGTFTTGITGPTEELTTEDTGHTGLSYDPRDLRVLRNRFPRDLRDPRGELPPPPAPRDISPDDVARALEPFRGTYWQTPPTFSAKKVDGLRSYRLARADRPVEPKPVEVTVREVALLAYEAGLARVRIVCSAGFYVRSLAHDLGEQLGCGAYLERLRRTRSGAFAIGQAVPLAILEADASATTDSFVPMDLLLTDLPAAVLSPRGAERAAHGNAVTEADVVRRLPGSGGLPPHGRAEAWPHEPAIRLLDGAGGLVAVARAEAGAVLHPIVVLV
jgi:tRNA pseudouridine55 synthase